MTKNIKIGDKTYTIKKDDLKAARKLIKASNFKAGERKIDDVT